MRHEDVENDFSRADVARQISAQARINLLRELGGVLPRLVSRAIRDACGGWISDSPAGEDLVDTIRLAATDVALEAVLDAVETVIDEHVCEDDA